MKYLVNSIDNITGQLNIKVGKNFLLNTIPGLLLLDGEIEIQNYIDYPDVSGLLEILNFLGVTHEKNNSSIIINTTNYQGKPITHPKAVIRSCFMIAGAMLTRDKKAYIPISYGWCTDMQSQKRACNFHLECFQKMGAQVDIWSKDNGDELVDIIGDNMEGTEYLFPKVSVTGTVNTVLAALGCKGTTILKNVSLEPEVIFAIELFQSWGYKIIFNKNIREIIIEGNYQFTPLKLEKKLILNLPSDRLLAGSFMMLPLMIGGCLNLKGIDIVKNNLTLIENLKNTGAHINIIDDHSVFIEKNKNDVLNSLNIIANPFPAIATDLFPFLVVLSIFCNGDSRLTDNVYNTRALSISLFLQKFNINIEILTGCDVIVKGHNFPINQLNNNDYQQWLNNIQNIRGQTAAFFFLLATQKNFEIDFNTYGSQIVRGYPAYYLMEDLKTIGLKFQLLNS
jgi:UDP-N-acetylglucosamine 1-carboxyvinyltransferase